LKEVVDVRKLYLIAWLSMLFIVQSGSVGAQSVETDCFVDAGEISACREFTATAGNADDTV